MGEVVDFSSKTSQKAGERFSNVSPASGYNNGNGGGGNMDKNNFVTHTELELSNQKLLNHIDNRFNQIDNRFSQLEKKIDNNQAETNLKFEKQKVWFYGTAITIIAATCTIVSFLLNHIK